MFSGAAAEEHYRRAEDAALKYLEPEVGGLTQTSKMPWLSFSLPAWACITGSLLRKIKGTVCYKCYAFNGFYQMGSTKKAQARRLEILQADPERWAGQLAAILKRKAGNIEEYKRYFRWHDSGDIQSEDHYKAICWIAVKVPEVMFYLPTKEREYYFERTPSNLVMRHSVAEIGGQAPRITTKLHATVGVPGDGFQCPAKDQDGQCRDCRACWDRRIPVINYTEQ